MSLKGTPPPLDIASMSEEEKSVAIAKICGWIRPKEGAWEIRIPEHLFYSCQYVSTEPLVLDNFNLYSVTDKSIAWEVFTWVAENSTKPEYRALLQESIGNPLFYNEAAEVVVPAFFLDRILEIGSI